MQTITIGGVDVTDHIGLIDGIVALESAADGDKAESQIVVDDPNDEFDFIQWQPVISIEDDCSQPRCITAWIENVSNVRGTNLTGTGRIWTLSVVDLNDLLHRRVMRLPSANRPRETGDQRMAWLLGSEALAGLVFDNGAISPNPWHFAAADYRGQYADAVLADISISSVSDLTGLLSFVYWDPVALEPSLFIGSPVGVILDSTLRISNLLSDVDGSVTFAPYQQPERVARGEQIADGIYFIYDGGALYRTRPSTYTAFGMHRDGVFSTDRVGAEGAALHAEQWLTYHSGEVVTIPCSLQLPASKVNLIDAGMRVQVKFIHLPGFETFTWMRVQRRTIRFTPGTNEFYDVDLELSNAGFPATGGGDPGDFPFDPACTPESMGLVQPFTQGGTTSVVMPGSGTLGNSWLWVCVGRTNGTFVPDTGTWTLRGTAACNQNVANDFKIALYTKPVESGDGTWSIVVNKSASSKYWMAEVPGDFDAVATLSTGNNVDATVSLTPTSGKTALLISVVDNATDDGTYSNAFVPVAGMTEALHVGVPAPIVAINTQVVANTTGSYTVGSTWPHNIFSNVAAVAVSFICDSADVPTPAQEVPGEFVALGDGTATTFTTAFPYAPLSLKVWVDGHPILLGLTETDPTIGSFTLDFAPLGPIGDSPAERVTATYQAAAGAVVTSVTVASIAALKTALANDIYDEIVVTNGTYTISEAQAQTTNSLYIGPAFASRTRPVTVRAATRGSVTFDGASATGGVFGMWFGNGAHHQTWDGFNFANFNGTAIEFGGFTPTTPPHDITMRFITVQASCHQAVSGSNQDHCIYMSNAMGRGPYNILLEDITLIGTASTSLRLWGGIHAYHGSPTDPPADHVTVRRLTTTGLWDPIVLWWEPAGGGASGHNWTFDGATITNAHEDAIRFESSPSNASSILFKDITSTGSGSHGFYSSLGPTPTGVTFINDSLA